MQGSASRGVGGKAKRARRRPVTRFPPRFSRFRRFGIRKAFDIYLQWLRVEYLPHSTLQTVRNGGIYCVPLFASAPISLIPLPDPTCETIFSRDTAAVQTNQTDLKP